MNVKRYIKELKRLFWAEADIRAARQLCEQALENEAYNDGWIWRAMESGIVVSYARPFGANVGLGTLPSRFELFPPETDFAKVHALLLSGRNLVAAHNNLLERKSVLASNVPAGEAERISITIEPNGQLWWTLPIPTLPADNIRRIVDLCRFQEERIRRESHALLIEITKSGKYEAGTYQLGVDFP